MIGSSSPLNDLIQWNQSALPAAVSPTTLQAAQQTLEQAPVQVVSSLAPANTSLYGAAPAADSLLGNISTSAGLSALSQINSTRSASDQISPFSNSSEAIAFGAQSENSVVATLLGSPLDGSADSSGLPAAYYSQDYSSDLTPSVPQLNIAA